MGNQIKTYRALHPLKVGGAVRQFGEFIPEAIDFPALRSYLSTNRIEMVWEDEDVIAKEMKAYAKRDAELSKSAVEEAEESVDSSDEPPKKTKKTAAKKTGKKVVKKKTVKEKAHGLAEQSV